MRRERTSITDQRGVLAAGRRKREAQLRDTVKGILSLCQILQDEMRKF